MQEENKKEVVKIRRKRHDKPTSKQITALHYISQGMSKRAAMIKAGYSVQMAQHNSSVLNAPRLLDILGNVKNELLRDPAVSSSYIVGKFKEWMEATKETRNGVVPDYQAQIAAYDRWKELVDNAENKSKKVKRSITFEEFVDD